MKYKKRKLNLVLNELKEKTSDPTKLHFSMIILDGEVSHNNVKVLPESLVQLGKSIKGMPIVTKYIENEDTSKNDFGSHEDYISEDVDGNKIIKRDTIAIGSFTSEGRIEKRIIDGVETDVLIGDGVLWLSRYKDIVTLIKNMFDNGIKINTSCEYLYSEYYFNENNVEIHHGDIFLEGTAILGSSYNIVNPAYDSATFTMLNNNILKKFNLAVAQALNNKEVNELENVKNEEQLNTEESTEEELDIETKVEEVSENESTDADVKSDEKEVEETKTQLNAKSLYDISEEIRNQVRANEADEEWLWVSDLYLDHAIVAIETSEDYKHYKFNYTIENDVVSVDLSSKVEVKEKREWVTVTNELSEKVNDLTEKFTNATNTITQLNSQLEELKPIKEQMELAQKEAKLTDVKTEFETKFNALGAKELFESEEIQLLLNQVAEDSIEAKLSLNEKLVEIASTKVEEVSKNPLHTIMNTVSKRDFSKVSKDNDPLSELRA